jgi:hypothetical protein
VGGVGDVGVGEAGGEEGAARAEEIPIGGVGVGEAEVGVREVDNAGESGEERGGEPGEAVCGDSPVREEDGEEPSPVRCCSFEEEENNCKSRRINTSRTALASAGSLGARRDAL